MIVDLGLKEKTVIVTGSAAGIGKRIATTFAKEGANVVIADLNEIEGANTVKECESIGVLSKVVKTDVTDLESLKKMVQFALDTFGQVDILVHNAAAFGPTWGGTFLERPSEEWDIEVKSCLYGAMNCAYAIIPHMVQRRSGVLINILSDAARVGEQRQVVYAGAKAGIGGFSRSLAKEVARYGIRLNCVAPSMTETDSPRFLAARQREKEKLGAEKYEELRKKRLMFYPLRRFGMPEDQANAVVFLASECAGWITGQTLSVNGGYAMGPW